MNHSSANYNTLKNFVQQANILERSRYATQLENEISVKMRFKDGVADTSRDGPDDDALRSFLLTLRFFCQDNEPTSIRNMDALLGPMNVDRSLKDIFRGNRNNLNQYLDGDTLTPGIIIGGERLTPRQIFEAFTYGQYAHLTKAPTIDGWEKLVFYDGIRAAYDQILRIFLRFIQAMKVAVEKVIEELDSSSPRPAMP